MKLKSYTLLKNIINANKKIIFERGEEVFVDEDNLNDEETNSIKIVNKGKIVYVTKEKIKEYFEIIKDK